MQCMGQEGSEASVASSPPAPPAAPSSWWRIDMHANHPLASSTQYSWPAAESRWPLPSPPSRHHHHHHHRTSSSGGDDDLSASNATMTTSFTNASTNHSGLSMDSAPPTTATATATAAQSHLWNQDLFAGAGEASRSMHMQDSHDDSENFLQLLNSKSLAPEMFAEPPACDYLKKMDCGDGDAGSHDDGNCNPSWEHFTTSAPSYTAGSTVQPAVPDRFTSLSDLVSHWSIAPPDPCHWIPPSSCRAGDISDRVKHEIETSYPGHGMALEASSSSSSSSCMNQEFGPPMNSFLRPVGQGYNPVLGLHTKICGGAAAMDAPWMNSNAKNLSDLISFGGALSKPLMDAGDLKPCVRNSDTFEYKKQGQEISSAKTHSKGGATTNEAKKKRSDPDVSEANLKKSKHETSPTSSVKSQVPKVKLGDKITALQQIVSPFGKTDTASVLYEAINYIKFLHEQVQLLSDPYMKSSSSKDYTAWGGLERREKAESEIDLKSRGLCLVPISWTPQVYRDNSVPDYWTPPYRSCLYR